MTADTATKVEELREQAKARDASAEESFQQSDTDGFLSQWASRLGADFDRERAKILEKGGAIFPALFDLEGNLVKAKLINGKYGKCWAFVGEDDKFTGKFISAYPKNRETMAKKGFLEGKVLQTAYAEYVGTSSNVFIASLPAKPVYEEPLEIISTDRWAQETV